MTERPRTCNHDNHYLSFAGRDFVIDICARCKQIVHCHYPQDKFQAERFFSGKYLSDTPPKVEEYPTGQCWHTYTYWNNAVVKDGRVEAFHVIKSCALCDKREVVDRKEL